MANFLETDDFNTLGFAEYPKCVGQWKRLDGAGCLLTAFLDGGFVNKFDESDWTTQVNDFAKKNNVRVYSGKELNKILNKKDNDVTRYPNGPSDFTQSVISLYDNKHETEALNLIWELIEHIPHRVKVSTKKTDVKMPAKVR